MVHRYLPEERGKRRRRFSEQDRAKSHTILESDGRAPGSEVPALYCSISSSGD